MNTLGRIDKAERKNRAELKKFSEYYGIPYRTVQDWYMGKRHMPEYLLKLMIYQAEMEKQTAEMTLKESEITKRL